jgi:hypothetical protein
VKLLFPDEFPKKKQRQGRRYSPTPGRLRRSLSNDKLFTVFQDVGYPIEFF